MMPGGRMRGDGNKVQQGKLWWNVKRRLAHGSCAALEQAPKRSRDPRPWKYSEPDQMRARASWSNFEAGSAFEWELDQGPPEVPSSINVFLFPCLCGF